MQIVLIGLSIALTLIIALNIARILVMFKIKHAVDKLGGNKEEVRKRINKSSILIKLSISYRKLKKLLYISVSAFSKRLYISIVVKVVTTVLLIIVDAVIIGLAIKVSAIDRGMKAAAVIVNEDAQEETSETVEDKWVYNEVDLTDVIGNKNSSNNNVSNNVKYVLNINGSNYVFFHQSTANDCAYCGEWNQMKWGSGSDISKYSTFGSDGCAVYSLAMAVSNLIGKIVTPLELLEVLGCNIERTDSLMLICNTEGSECFINGNLIVYYKALEAIKNAYGIEYKELGNMNNKPTSDSIDAVINSGGYVWTQWKSSTSPWTGLSGHFMLIRAHNSTSYLCITSSTGRISSDYTYKGSVETMKTSWDKQSCISEISAYVFGLTYNGVKGQLITDNTEINVSGSSDWYTSASGSKSTSYIEIGEKLKLYRGFPWDADSVDIVDMDIVKEDIYEYIKSSGDEMRYGISRLLTYNSCASLGETIPSRGEGWERTGDGVIKQLDGVYCIGVAVPPAILNRSYCDNFEYSSWKEFGVYSEDSYNYSNMKMAIILESKTDGNYYYLPATSADSKGHTFPGGMVQTNVKIVGYEKSEDESTGTFHVLVARSDEDPTGYDDWWEEGELSYYINNKQISASNNAGYNYPISYMHSICEIFGLAEDVYFSLIDKYRFKGYVVWR